MENAPKRSLIIDAITQAEKGSTGEIRVHLCRHWIEKDAYRRAERLFEEFGMARTADRNAVLIYVNLRRRRFALLGGSGLNETLKKTEGPRIWESLAAELAANLRSTHHEKAIALSVARIGELLRRHFPATEP